MKRKRPIFRFAWFLWLCLLSGISFRTYAGPVSPEEALRAAKALRASVMKGNTAMLKAVPTRMTRAARTPAYYVFNADDRSGFVLVSGDDRLPPILGYATVGTFRADSLPDGLQDLLTDYESQVAALDAMPETGVSAASFTGERLLETAQWNQTEPFNRLCPEGYPSGCVATAMSIVMRYHNWPEQGVGRNSYDWISPDGTSHTISADFGTTTYEWSNMPLAYEVNSYTETQAQAVATLMFHAGVSVNMNYHPDGSSAALAYARYALMDNFRYMPSVQYVSAASYSSEEWAEKLRAEIDDDRPVIYEGSGQGAHAFVLDGYQNDLFHINWGWGGYCNGYYSLGNMAPNAEQDYTSNQSALLGIAPNRDGTVASPLVLQLRNDGSSGIVSNHSTIVAGKSFCVNLGKVWNAGAEDFQGKVIVALCAEGGRMKAELGSMDCDLPSGYYYTSSSTIWCMAPDNPSDGDRIRVLAKANGETEYTEVWTADGRAVSLPAIGYQPETFAVEYDLGESIHSTAFYETYQYDGKPVKYFPYTFDVRYSSSDLDFMVVQANGAPVHSTNTGTSMGYQRKRFTLEEPNGDVLIKVRGYFNTDIVENADLHVPEAGTLEEQAEAAGLNMDITRKLTITGEIDSRDFVWLKGQTLLEGIDMERSSVKAYGTDAANRIPDYAFEFCNNLTSFVMPSGLTSIGNNAFRQSGLKDIAIPAGVKSIGLNAFNYCTSLREVYAYNPEPVWISWCVFIGTLRDVGGTLHVPRGSKEKYESASEWNSFTYIIDDLEPPLAIGEVECDPVDEDKVVYDLSGRRVTNPRSGIYIVKGKKVRIR